MSKNQVDLGLIVSKYRRWVIVLLILLVDLLLNLMLLAFAPDLFTYSEPVVAQATEVTQVANRIVDATNTPYQPLHPTPTSLPVILPTVITPSMPAASPHFYGLDFRPEAERLTIRIQPNDDRLNRVAPIEIVVRPSNSCTFGDKQACVSYFRNRSGGNVIWVTVHSGIGGQAESYRRVLEGIGLGQAAFSPARIQANLKRITGAGVQISQDDVLLTGMRLGAAVRLPGDMLADYFRRPPSGALALAASSAPKLSAYLDSEQPMIVFETCGWKLPGEPWTPGISSTSASVYLGVIQVDEYTGAQLKPDL